MSSSDKAKELLEKERGTVGPASEELQAALGINPADLDAAVLGRRVERRSEEPVVLSDRDRMREKAMRIAEQETVDTKEAIFTVIATYLANKPAEWWRSPYVSRDQEIRFLSEALVDCNRMLENDNG